MKPSRPILVALLAALLSPTADASAEPAWPWWQRPLLAPRQAADAERLLAAALQRDKAFGHLDSAAAGYRRVLDLHRQRRATAAVAARAWSRLQRLSALGLAEMDAAAGPGSPSAGPAAAPAARVARSLQLDPRRLAPSGPAERGDTPIPDGALEARRRWLQRALRRRAGQSGPPSPSGVLAAVGSAVEAVRDVLGLRGVPHYVESQLRRRRQRPLAPHEQWLLALMAEKEYGDFGGAARRYRELAQLSPNRGIATRLIERARQGAARCARWQRPASPGP